MVKRYESLFENEDRVTKIEPENLKIGDSVIYFQEKFNRENPDGETYSQGIAVIIKIRRNKASLHNGLVIRLNDFKYDEDDYYYPGGVYKYRVY